MLQTADRRQAYHMKRDTSAVSAVAATTTSRPLSIVSGL
jgi:hypothetical protein